MLGQEGYDLMGAAFEVYNHLGHGFLEDVYQESLEKELTLRNIPFEVKPRLTVSYKGMPLRQINCPDLIVHRGIIVELKAVQQIAKEHLAQLLNYMKATGKRVGYLINFGCSGDLEWKRIIL